MKPIYAFDFETYYSKTYSIKDLGNYNYTHHPEFDPYLLSVVGAGDTEGFEWCGHPKDFEWPRLQNAVLWSWNAGFEFAVTTRLQELGVAPIINWESLYDAADLAAYLGLPRSLAEGALGMFGIKADKTMRDKAKGKHWNDMDTEFQTLMTTYALNDSRVTLRAGIEFGPCWPDWEKLLSKETREMCWKGIPADKEQVHKAVKGLETRLHNAREIIPWVKKDPEAPVLSLKKAGMEARAQGITPPSSFAKDSPEFEAWAEENREKLPWVSALSDYRSINILAKRVDTLYQRIDDEGNFRYGMKYFGAHTGRDSGDGGFNAQNMPRDTMHGVNLRGMFVAPKGYTFGIVDESAIEPRCLAVLAEDEELVRLLREGYDPYEAQARATGAYNDPRPLKEVDPELRQFKKVEVLGLGYGAGAAKAQIITKQWTGMEIDLERAEQLVGNFRARKFIPDLWRKLEGYCANSAPGNFELELPSGRILTYRNVKRFGSVSAEIPRLGRMMRVKLWGGSLTENFIQGVARDIFMWHVLQIREAGYPRLLRAHDEVVTLLKEETAEQDLIKIEQIMGTAPPWMPDFPAKAEGALSKVYKKI